MKKLLSFLLLFAFIMAPQSSLAPSASADPSTPLYGRLSIESVNIDVALYNSNAQSVCDDEDSACFFNATGYAGMTIADHSYQTFTDLPRVRVDDEAVITLNNGGKIYLTCVETYSGKNTGAMIYDPHGEEALGQHDYITYTCLPGDQRIRICQWDIVYAEDIDRAYDKGFNIDTRTALNVVTCSEFQIVTARGEDEDGFEVNN